MRLAIKLIASAGVALAAPLAAALPPTTTDDFCVSVQQQFAGTRLVPDSNTIYADYPAFRASKTSVKPLTTHQYVMSEPDRPGAPMRVSCKVKTPDHLNAAYGPGTAVDRGVTCADLNRETVSQVYARLTPAERRSLRLPENRIVFDDDITTFMGSSWVGEFPFAYTGTDGRLHLQAKTLRVDWDNVWFSWAPDRLRGAFYCHMVAPEYVRRLALGEVSAPAAD
jgi:hypothetical protein